jgi:hypothetical protein
LLGSCACIVRPFRPPGTDETMERVSCCCRLPPAAGAAGLGRFRLHRWWCFVLVAYYLAYMLTEVRGVAARGVMPSPSSARAHVSLFHVSNELEIACVGHHHSRLWLHW